MGEQKTRNRGFFKLLSILIGSVWVIVMGAFLLGSKVTFEMVTLTSTAWFVLVVAYGLLELRRKTQS